MPPPSRILLVIPTYNNRPTLRGVVEDAVATGLAVLVVNDGSDDGGPETLADLPVARLDLPGNMGKGAAIRAAAGWADEAGYTHLVTMDADGQHDARDAHRFVEAVARNPWAIVVGRRDLAAADAPRASRFGRAFSNAWLRVATGVAVPDTQCGFRAWPVAVLRRLRGRTTRFDFEVEALIRAAWAGVALESVPISVRYDPPTGGGRRVSHFRPWIDNARISLVYARSVLRQLLPWPHARLERPGERRGRHAQARRPFSASRLRRWLIDLFRERASPGELGLAAALGVFLGTLPLIGVHCVTIVFAATRLRLNRLLALNISHLCAPPLVPALAVELGHLMRHGRLLTQFNLRTLGYEAPERLLEYLIGSVALAPILGVAAGVAMYGAARGWQWRRRQRHRRPTPAQHSPNYGGRTGHAIFRWILRRFGVRPAYGLLALIVPYYVAIRVDARRRAMPYLRRRFPRAGALGRWWRCARLDTAFGRTLIDQGARGILGERAATVEFPDERRLYDLAARRRGLILVTSHVGCWQSAMADMAHLPVPVTFQFRREPHTEGRHFFDMDGRRDRFHLVSPDGFLGGTVELTQALRRGECVGVMGDRAFGARTAQVPFLGEPATFPLLAYRLAHHTDAEVVALLTARTGRMRHRIEMVELGGPGVSEEEMLRRYVRALEAFLDRHPLMWFNFFDLWAPPR